MSRRDDNECSDLVSCMRSALAIIYLGTTTLIVPWLCFGLLGLLLCYPLLYPTYGFWGVLSTVTALAYIWHWSLDADAPFQGGHQCEWMRKIPIWRWAAEHFPIRLRVSSALRSFTTSNVGDWETEQGEQEKPVHLPDSANYLVGYHPHGPIAIGALLAFASEACNFTSIFPGLKSYLATLNLHFRVPFHRDFILRGGVVSVAKDSLTYLLDAKVGGYTGNFVVVPVGGATEALASHPGTYVIELSKRYGFFKLALTTGAQLMPCLGFGETQMFDQVKNPPGSRLRRFQEWVTHYLTVSPPLLYSKYILPHRFPINIVVGKPIRCAKTNEPSDAEVCKLREEYRGMLVDLFNEYRPLYDPTADDITFV